MLGADLTCYQTQVGTVPGFDTEDFSRWEYKEFVDSLRALFAASVNPLQVARDAAREHGAEFHIMIRPGAWQGTAALEEVFNSRFFQKHPEWRCVDRDGTPTFYMSYAVPEVQQQVLDILREALTVEPDGVGFMFHRGLPLMLWEDAFSEQFQQEYGENAQAVAEDDPRIYALRAKIMTGFLRQVRNLLDEVQQGLGREKPLTISVATFSKQSDNRKYGIAIEQWIDEQLVNDIAVAWFAHHTSFSEPGSSRPDMTYYRRITAGKDVGLYPFVICWKPGHRRACVKRSPAITIKVPQELRSGIPWLRRDCQIPPRGPTVSRRASSKPSDCWGTKTMSVGGRRKASPNRSWFPSPAMAIITTAAGSPTPAFERAGPCSAAAQTVSVPLIVAPKI